jgi:acetyl-CoA carboxylase biotin carboxyl carrier protein
MIDMRKLKELVRLMVENDLTEMDLRDSQEQVSLQRPSSLEQPTVIAGGVPVAMPATVPAAAPSAAPGVAVATAPPASETSALPTIDSPMVGTYFSATTPDADPFVKVGDTVSADTVVCIIEAMKIFNEIKAERSGTIREIRVQNGDAVEFGQPLIAIDES